ncbi:hypothetical protein Cgig2_022408 [Carnegiea gigantea]|uniref:Uncharacterized protein n=1 Tax=Carnegiea gigantea TaxID=171969 RepID=A0A9Q1KGH7_9CARY|nr:hypothetical protein Cgig2_022408 [Carnegiea gigantea]
MPIERTHQYTSPEVLRIVDIGGPLVSFPLGAFPNLRSLTIHECYNNLENASIPGGTDLKIVSCKVGKPLLGDGKDLPFTLASPSIDFFHELIAHWIFLSEGVTNISTLYWHFPNLTSIHGQALGSLPSRQELQNCPKLQYKPEEGLPSSLGRLHIKGCPLVEERYQRKKGQNWTKICHHSCVRINGILI